MPPDLPPLSASSKSSLVARELEARILSGEFPPGMRLPTEVELMNQLGVSRSVVRDAVRTLAARGLVDVLQGRGMTVAEPDAGTFGHALITLLARSELTMGDVVTARAALETSLGRLAATRGHPQDWITLEEHLTALDTAVKRRDWDGARDAHLAFHVAIIHAMHLPAMELMLLPMTEVIMLSAVPPHANRVEDWGVDRHSPILDALRANDPDATEQAMREHFRATADWPKYQQYYDQSFSLASSLFRQQSGDRLMNRR